MADTIDINVFETTEVVTINATPNLIQVNINKVTSTGAVSSVNGQTGDVTIATSDNNFTNTLKTKLDGIQAGATANDTDANLKNRANHTGTQLAATISDFATAVSLLITNKVDKVTGYSLTKNDLTDALKTVYDNAVSSLTTLLATGQRLITSSEITKLSNTSGTNTGDQNLSGLVPYTGASTDVDLNTKNLKVNNVFEGFTSVAASATLITLTVSSTPSYLVTGSGGQTIKLPDATTLPNGAIYDFNNNQSSGAISVNNNSNTLVKSVPSGNYLVLTLIDNSTAAGSWDAHFQAPSNVSWSTNTFDYPGSITGATWNGVSIADNRIASAATWNAKEDSTNKVTTFTGNETSTTKFPAVKAILDYFSATNIKTILGITTLSGSNTGDETQSTILSKLAYYNYKNTSSSSSTSSLSEFPLLQVTIPANTFSATDFLRFTATFVKTGVNAVSNIKFKLSTSSTMPSGSTGQIATVQIGITSLFGQINRNLSIKSGNITGWNFGISAFTDNAGTTSAISSQSFDPTVTNYFYVSATMLSISDSLYMNSIQITNI